MNKRFPASRRGRAVAGVTADGFPQALVCAAGGLSVIIVKNAGKAKN